MNEFTDEIKQLERIIVNTDAKAAGMCRRIESINSWYEEKINSILISPQFQGVKLVQRLRPFSVHTPLLRYRRLVRFNGDPILPMSLDEETRRPLDSIISNYYHERDALIHDEFNPIRKGQKQAYDDLLERSTILAFQQEICHGTSALYLSDPEEEYVVCMKITKDGGTSTRTQTPNIGMPSKEDMYNMERESTNKNVFYISNPSSYIPGKMLMNYAIKTIFDKPERKADRLIFVSYGPMDRENN